MWQHDDCVEQFTAHMMHIISSTLWICWCSTCVDFSGKAHFNYYWDVKRMPYFYSWNLLYVTDNADEVASIKGPVPVEINTVLITYDCVRVKVHPCAWWRTWVIQTYLAALWTGRVVRLHVVFEGVRWVEVWWVADGAVRDVGRGGRGKDGWGGERQRRMRRWTPGGDNCTHTENSYISDWYWINSCLIYCFSLVVNTL